MPEWPVESNEAGIRFLNRSFAAAIDQAFEISLLYINRYRIFGAFTTLTALQRQCSSLGEVVRTSCSSPIKSDGKTGFAKELGMTPDHRGLFSQRDATDQEISLTWGVAIEAAFQNHKRSGVALATWDEENQKVLLISPTNIEASGVHTPELATLLHRG